MRLPRVRIVTLLDILAVVGNFGGAEFLHRRWHPADDHRRKLKAAKREEILHRASTLKRERIARRLAARSNDRADPIKEMPKAGPNRVARDVIRSIEKS